jgi:Lipid A 3-O-deacylase (PagL)
MKKSLLLAGILSCIMGFSYAQSSIELIPTAGYTFADQLNFSNTFGRIQEGFNYGGALQFNFSRRMGIELMYNRMDVNANLYNYGAVPGDIPQYHTNGAINYIMAGPVTSFPLPGTSSSLFIGANLGAAIFSPSPNTFSSNAAFAYGFQTGANIYLNPRVGIRLSGRLLGTAPTSSGYYFGYWGDPNGGYYSNPGILQFGFNAGLIIGLGSVLPEYHHPAKMHRTPPPRRYYYYP